MRKYNIPPAFSGSLQLGRQGENGVTEITFLCAGYAKMYGGALAQNGAGLGQAHNNMPPYIAVYVWKRTA